MGLEKLIKHKKEKRKDSIDEQLGEYSSSDDRL